MSGLTMGPNGLVTTLVVLYRPTVLTHYCNHKAESTTPSVTDREGIAEASLRMWL